VSATVPDVGVPFPPSVFEAQVLRGLDARARREIEAAGRLMVLGPGAKVFRSGEQGEAFFVVADGEIALEALKRGDAVATEVRRARTGDSFGEECTIGLARRADAVVRSAATVAEIPVHVFRRAAGRSAAQGADKLERVLRRAATRDLFATIAFTRSLPDRDLDVLLDAAAHLTVPRGQPVYMEGEPARELYFVIDGLVQLQHDDGDRLHVRGYVGRGDFFGDAEITSGTERRSSAVASGKSALVAVPAAVVQRLIREHPQLLPAMRRVAEAQADAQRAVVGKAAMNATGHVFKDLYRMQVARSLLVIDLETCVRCGHCAWACAEVHGESRLVRRGDKTIARVDGRGDGAPTSLLLPNSCQHCESPACMVDCPTGAIAKDAGGEVFIRPELCTGCGACAKACPWENIQMSTRPIGTPKPTGNATDFELLAVKCDLCRGYEAPACVQACPTESIFRLNPAEEIGDVRELLRGAPAAAGARSATPSAAPLVIGATLAAIAFAGVGSVMRAREAWSSGSGAALGLGVAAAGGMVGLLAYAFPKRGVRLWMKKRAGDKERDAHVTSRVKKQVGVHIALGLLTAGLALAHAPLPFRGASSTGVTLSALLLASTFFGVLTAIAYAIVPRRLAALERRSALPEDFAGARRGLVDRLFREASGKSDLVKKLIETDLVPYANLPLAWIALLSSGRSLRDEEQRVRARIDAKLQGRGREKLAGLDGLVKLVVELRALKAQRWLLRALRFGLPLHIVTFALATAALALHVGVAVLRGRT
jgi:Fe-S-cluster-containing dehydrogenase component/CRP-like cAMP-binding protein